MPTLDVASCPHFLDEETEAKRVLFIQGHTVWLETWQLSPEFFRGKSLAFFFYHTASIKTAYLLTALK